MKRYEFGQLYVKHEQIGTDDSADVSSSNSVKSLDKKHKVHT